MRLTDDWKIEQKDSNCVTLIHIVDSKDKKGIPKKKEVTYYYGTLYQALQGFLTKASQEEKDIEAVGFRIVLLLDTLRTAQHKIKRAFKTEVRTTR